MMRRRWKEEFEGITARGAFAQDEVCRRTETERKRGEGFKDLMEEVASAFFDCCSGVL